MSKQDNRLLKKLRKGDKKAFEQVYQLYKKPLAYFLMGYVKSAEDTEEIIQDTFIKLWENREKIDTKQSFKSYLFKISKHTFLNKLRRKNIETDYRNQVLAEYSESDNTTENEIILADYEYFYAKAIDDLPPRRRDIFLLSRKRGMTYAEIADTLQISQKTVEKQMSEAIRYIKSKLLMDNGTLINILLLLQFSLVI